MVTERFPLRLARCTHCAGPAQPRAHGWAPDAHAPPQPPASDPREDARLSGV